MPTDSDLRRLPSVEAWAKQRLCADKMAAPLRSALSELVAILESERCSAHDTFLTVVIRTQARRLEQLQDGLLCLFAQTDQNFEVMIMLHDVALEDEAQVRAIVDEYPADFSSRVTLHPVAGGGRSRPLLASTETIRGEYVAFFDDDDLLMANWVEAFREAAKETPGQVIRANVAVQNNRVETWVGGAVGQRTVGLVLPAYADHFSMIDHLERNHTPFMGFAFPASFFTFWGESFDEDLAVCEDWDVALRAAGLLGVNSSAELTAIYRQWEDAETSYTHHAQEEWVAAADAIKAKLNQTPLLMPAGTSEQAIELLSREHRAQQELAVMLGSTFWRLTSPLRRIVDRFRPDRSGK